LVAIGAAAAHLFADGLGIFGGEAVEEPGEGELAFQRVWVCEGFARYGFERHWGLAFF
jgi:hypothetical protein